MSFFATPKRLKQSNNLADSECRLRVGQAYNTDFPWDSCTSPELKKWLGLVSGARKCRPEYVLLSLLPSISALSGPDTRLEISEGFHSEKLNLFMCILGESGANKSGAYGLTTGVMKAMADTERLVLDSNWSRSGLLGHLRDTRGTCLLSYEEMDPFFSNVLKMEKQGVSERTFFCELYDGRPQSITRSTNDGKVCRHMIGETTMNIIGYHQPEPFLKDYFELSLRRDGFMERFLICCPQSLRISQPEVETCRADLAQSYNHSMRDLKALYAQIYELFREGGKVYRLSPNASAQYQELAAEENEDYNRNLQQKMAEASQPGAEPVVPDRQLDPQLETKFVRSVLKLSATLHILEGVFSSLTKEDDGSGSPPVIPSDISEGTLKRGRALAQYFAAQRHILFKPVTEDVTDLPRTDTLVRRILLCRGYVANRREIRGSYNLATRPKPEEVDGVFAELETNGCGKVAKEGAYEGFIKNPTLTDQYAAKYNITIEEYDAKLTAVSPWLSKKPKAEETFRKLYLAAYPDTAPSVSIVKSEQKSP